MKYGDIFWVSLPDRGGHEQRGRRPAIIWQDTDVFQLPTVLIIPLTGSTDALRFPGTLPIDPSATNGLTARSVALVFQLGACDLSRVSDQLGHVEDADLTKLQNLAKRLQKLP